jgi:hypothetical protein
MQRTNVEAHVILKIIGGKVGRWSVANRDYRKIFYDVGKCLFKQKKETRLFDGGFC